MLTKSQSRWECNPDNTAKQKYSREFNSREFFVDQIKCHTPVMTLMNSSTSTMIITGRVIFAPFLIASEEPM